jgi:hypothetical protein
MGEFKKVEPLIANGVAKFIIWTDKQFGTRHLSIGTSDVYSYEDAVRLRDWLNDALGVVPEDVRDARRYRWLRQYLQVQADGPGDWTCWLAIECIPYRSKTDSAEELLDMLMSRFPLAAS